MAAEVVLKEAQPLVRNDYKISLFQSYDRSVWWNAGNLFGGAQTFTRFKHRNY
jgi:hypothetical protein